MTTLEELGTALGVIQERIQAFGPALVAEIAEWGLGRFVALTPIRTGRARASTVLAADAPAFAPPMPGRGPFRPALDLGPVARMRAGSPGFLTQAARRVEGASYSGFLDLGRSRQAPAGMTAPFEAALRAEMPALSERAAARIYP